MTDLIPQQGLIHPPQPRLEDMHENLILGITTLVRQASGVKDAQEFNLLYGRPLRELQLVTDHIILLAIERGANK